MDARYHYARVLLLLTATYPECDHEILLRFRTKTLALHFPNHETATPPPGEGGGGPIF